MGLIKLSTLKEKSMPGSVKWMGQKITYEYYPARIDGKHDDLVNEGMTANDREKIYEGMCLALKSWNVSVDGEKEVELTPEAMTKADLPTALVVAVLNQYQDDARSGSLQAAK